MYSYLPDVLAMQLQSLQLFFDQGLGRELHHGFYGRYMSTSKAIFDANHYRLAHPRVAPCEAIARRRTYSTSIYLPISYQNPSRFYKPQQGFVGLKGLEDSLSSSASVPGTLLTQRVLGVKWELSNLIPQAKAQFQVKENLDNVSFTDFLSPDFGLMSQAKLATKDVSTIPSVSMTGISNPSVYNISIGSTSSVANQTVFANQTGQRVGTFLYTKFYYPTWVSRKKVDFTTSTEPNFLAYAHGVDACASRTPLFAAVGDSLPRQIRSRGGAKNPVSVVGQPKLKYTYIGQLPLLTEDLSFVINGVKRILISQILRCPNIYCKLRIAANNMRYYSVSFLSYRGMWVRFERDKNSDIWVRINNYQKIPLITFVTTLGISRQIINATISALKINKQTLFRNELFRGETLNDRFAAFTSLGWITEVRESRKDEPHTGLQRGRFFILQLFRPSQYTFHTGGRYRMQRSFGDATHITSLRPEDLLIGIQALLDLEQAVRPVDDIDHLQYRRVRLVNELMETQVNLTLRRILAELGAERVDSSSHITSLHKELVALDWWGVCTKKEITGWFTSQISKAAHQQARADEKQRQIGLEPLLGDVPVDRLWLLALGEDQKVASAARALMRSLPTASVASLSYRSQLRSLCTEVRNYYGRSLPTFSSPQNRSWLRLSSSRLINFLQPCNSQNRVHVSLQASSNRGG